MAGCVLPTQRERYERKLQKVRVSSAKSQAKSALTMFELRDENTKLLEENARLLGEDSQSPLPVSYLLG